MIMSLNNHIAVVICQCRGRLTESINLEVLKNFAKECDGVASVRIVDSLCTSPELLKFKQGHRLVVAGCTVRKHLNLFKQTLEKAGISSFLCEFVDLLNPLDSGQKTITEATAYAKLIIKAHIKKLNKAPQAVTIPNAGRVEKLLNAPREHVTRRGFLRLPLILTDTVSPIKEIPLIDQSRCIAPRSPCRECVNLCPFEALAFRNGQMMVRGIRCKSCGLCMVFCPSDAIRMPSFGYPQALTLLEALADRHLPVGQRWLVFTCDLGRKKIDQIGPEEERLPGNPLLVKVPCIASLSPAILLRSLMAGFDAVVPLCSDKDCPNRKTVEKWNSTLDSLCSVLKAWNIPLRLATLILVRGKVVPTLLDTYENILSEFGPAHLTGGPTSFSLHPREDLIMAMSAIAEEKEIIDNIVGDLPLPFFDITIDEAKCCMCGACVRQCPPKALMFGKGEEAQIVFSSSICAGCGACASCCPENAISIHTDTNLSMIQKGALSIKASSESARCRNCGNIIGKKRLLEKVESRLRELGFDRLTEELYYCRDCKNMVTFQSEDTTQG